MFEQYLAAMHNILDIYLQNNSQNRFVYSHLSPFPMSEICLPLLGVKGNRLLSDLDDPIAPSTFSVLPSEHKHLLPLTPMVATTF